MLEKIKQIPSRARNLVTGTSSPDAKPILERLSRIFRQESVKSLATLANRSDDLHPVHELHIAIENLTNSDTAVRQIYRSKDWVGAESALIVLNEGIVRTTNLIQTGVISRSIDAGEIAMRTLNLLFTTKQNVKQEFGIITELDLNRFPKPSDPSKPLRIGRTDIQALPGVPQMILSAAMIFQLRQSLFPAERMIVGASRRIDGNIEIEALFDVTGKASESGVKADPDRLGQALIAMAETGTYFGLWVHSHPGTGPGATHPSGIDVRQHGDWLKDYSADLVSAIMVSDRYIRFWGTAVESGKITVAVEGGGIGLVSQAEYVYRLG